MRGDSSMTFDEGIFAGLDEGTRIGCDVMEGNEDPGTRAEYGRKWMGTHRGRQDREGGMERWDATVHANEQQLILRSHSSQLLPRCLLILAHCTARSCSCAASPEGRSTVQRERDERRARFGECCIRGRSQRPGVSLIIHTWDCCRFWKGIED